MKISKTFKIPLSQVAPVPVPQAEEQKHTEGEPREEECVCGDGSLTVNMFVDRYGNIAFDASVTFRDMNAGTGYDVGAIWGGTVAKTHGIALLSTVIILSDLLKVTAQTTT